MQQQDSGSANQQTTVHTAAAESYSRIARERREADKRTDRMPFREFNNFVKSWLISSSVVSHLEHTNASTPPRLAVLDLACGRGGDTPKWLFQKLVPPGALQGASAKVAAIPKAVFDGVKVGTFVGVDIAADAVDEARVRYEGMLGIFKPNPPPNVAFITDNAFLPPSTTKGGPAPVGGERNGDTEEAPSSLYWGRAAYDVVSCQFAFHYAWSSLDSAKAVVALVADSLRPRGIFCVTIVRSELLTSERSNDLFAFTGVSALTASTVGSSYKVEVGGFVDCDEFVVPFDVLIGVCEDAGLVCVPELCVDFTDAKLLALWDEHIRTDKKKVKNGGAAAFTLSSSEIELVGMYRTLGFVKV